MPPVLHWINSLLSENIEPRVHVISTHASEAAAVEVEMRMVEAFRGTILNSPKLHYCMVGKPKGLTDQPSGCRHKRQSWKQTKNFRLEMLDQTKSIAGSRVARRKKREAAGYPFPELSRRHPKNVSYDNRWHRELKYKEGGLTHRQAALKLGATKRQAAALMRASFGFPEPQLTMTSAANRKHYALLKEQGVDLKFDWKWMQLAQEESKESNS